MVRAIPGTMRQIIRRTVNLVRSEPPLRRVSAAALIILAWAVRAGAGPGSAFSGHDYGPGHRRPLPSLSTPPAWSGQQWSRARPWLAGP